MRKNYTDIIVIIDKSGSMGNLRKDVIGGFNSFVDDQKNVDGHATLSLIQFDDVYEVNYIAKDIKDVEHLTHKTYSPRGMTALYDAIGKTINAAGERFSAMKEEDRPEKVIVVVQTDGHENASREYKLHTIKDMIKLQENTYSWEFVFLGAKIDAVSVATDMGINPIKAMKFADNSNGMTYAYAAISKNVANVRLGNKADMSYEQEDYTNQTRAGV